MTEANSELGCPGFPTLPFTVQRNSACAALECGRERFSANCRFRLRQHAGEPVGTSSAGPRPNAVRPYQGGSCATAFESGSFATYRTVRGFAAALQSASRILKLDGGRNGGRYPWSNPRRLGLRRQPVTFFEFLVALE
jgi:hypothetical protein